MVRFQRGTVLVTAALSMLLGSLYYLRAFGPTEAEVAQWGLFCMAAGILALWPAVSPPRRRWLRVSGAVGFGLLAVAQLPPILLWFIFHGASISDGSPPTSFAAHWGWAIPHAFLLLTALASAGFCWRLHD